MILMKKFSYGRALLVFKVASVCQAWADRFLTRGLWLGRYLMKKRLLIASALCSSTGHLCKILWTSEGLYFVGLYYLLAMETLDT